ncbi:hypothetical protein BVC80_8255g12 [Macleaya cordata]|uniref:Retrotransposon gag domain-containing protein n=1 Tax=Macleaya cordata TaxID=56857 RepID=A0A200Q457_MACCD|nr:hypothetical protein BVC80_8255g12 [Macleaya cordata]
MSDQEEVGESQTTPRSKKALEAYIDEILMDKLSLILSRQKAKEVVIPENTEKGQTFRAESSIRKEGIPEIAGLTQLHEESVPFQNCVPNKIGHQQDEDSEMEKWKRTPMYQEFQEMKEEFRKSRMGTYDADAWYQAPSEKLPPNFKFPKMEKYDGFGCPKAHLTSYMGYLKPLGISNELLVHLFQRSLTGLALRWFATLDRKIIPTWPTLTDTFMKQFSQNSDTMVTKRQLEALKQKEHESFTDFIARWQLKIREMIDRPSEEEQIAIILRNVNHEYKWPLSIVSHHHMADLIKSGTQMEDAARDGARFMVSAQSENKYRKTNKEHVNYITPPQPQGVPSVIQPKTQAQAKETIQPPVQSQFQGKSQNKERREFSNLGHPMSEILPLLVEAGVLTRREPMPPPDPLPKWYKANLHCDFHQAAGHATDRCIALRHEIQNLLEANKINIPGVTLPSKPNINSNPLPTYRVEGQQFVNYIDSTNTIDPSKFIRTMEGEERNSVFEIGESSQQTPISIHLTSDFKRLELEAKWPTQTKEMAKSKEFEKEDSNQETGKSIGSGQDESASAKEVDKPTKTKGPILIKPGAKAGPITILISQNQTWEDPLKEENKECHEIQHQTRGGRHFKPSHLRMTWNFKKEQ